MITRLRQLPKLHKSSLRLACRRNRPDVQVSSHTSIPLTHYNIVTLCQTDGKDCESCLFAQTIFARFPLHLSSFNGSRGTEDPLTTCVEPRVPSKRPRSGNLHHNVAIGGIEQDAAGLATPPASQQNVADMSHWPKRQRPLSLSPSIVRTASKRGRFGDVEQRATSPVSEDLSCFEVAAGDVNIDDDSSSTTLTEPTPVVRRDRVLRQDENVLHDPTVFSPKPFSWDEWTPKDYLALSTFLEASFDANEFARTLSNLDGHRRVTTEEVNWMLRAVVTRPLRLAECSRRRGKEGMAELRECVEKYGTEIRVWSEGRTKVRGEFLGLKDHGVVIALATTKFGKIEQDLANRFSEGLVVQKGSGQANLSLKRLRRQDREYLETILSRKDLKVFRRWQREIRGDCEPTEENRQQDIAEPQRVAEI